MGAALNANLPNFKQQAEDGAELCQQQNDSESSESFGAEGDSVEADQPRIICLKDRCTCPGRWCTTPSRSSSRPLLRRSAADRPSVGFPHMLGQMVDDTLRVDAILHALGQA